MPSFSRLRTSILRRSNSNSPEPHAVNASDDSPEALATRGVQAFCESDSTNGQGEEVQHLPGIVEATESTPAAAAAAAYQIRKYLSKKNSNRPSVQYNAVMLMRLLCNHPGQPFTMNIDQKFVETTAHLLRDCKQQSVQQILRETLDILEIENSQDEGLRKLIRMWKMNKGHNARFNVPLQVAAAPQMGGAWSAGNESARPTPRRLPPAAELASRVEEARNSAKITIQLVQSTPLDEILISDLIREFSERCQNAHTSLQRYIACDNPPPDPDTMQTLIETSEQLSLSLSKVQRAKLNARRTLGLAANGASSTPPPETNSNPPLPSRELASPQPQHGKPQATRLAPAPTKTPPPFTVRVTEPESQDPFADFNAELSTMDSQSTAPQSVASQNVAPQSVAPQSAVPRHAAHPTIAHRPSNRPQPSTMSATAPSPYTASGANGPGATAQPVYRY